MRLRLQVGLILPVTLTWLALAQVPTPAPITPTGSGISNAFGSGMGTLTVQVLGEDHGFLDVQALVRLRNLLNSTEQWQTTRQRTDAAFSSLFAGNYQVEVSALGYKTATSTVDLYGTSETIQVVLKKDLNTESYAVPTLNISRKARQAAEKGLLALQTGNLKDAEKDFASALKLAPQNAQVNYLLGVVLVQEKRAAEAEKYFQQAIGLDPRHLPALTALGGLRLQQKDYAGAATLLQDAIAVNSRQWRPHWLLANTRLMQKDYPAALAEAQLAVELSKGAAPLATLVLGEALANVGRTDEALTALQRFLQQAPKDPDAPAVRQMIATLQQGPEAAPAAQVVSLNLSGATSRATPALALMAPAWTPPGVDDVLPPVASGVACPLARVLEGTGQNMKRLADDLDRFSATETQVHEGLDLLGKPLVRQTRKSEYLAALSQPRPGSLQLSEFRRSVDGLGGFSDGVSTSGMLGLAFIFHPAMQENYEMVCEGLGQRSGEPAWLVHFRQRPDRPRRVHRFKTSAQNYEVSLKGRAWIGAASFKIMRIEAELLEPLREAQLMLEHQIGNYGAVDFKAKDTQLWLPKDTETYLEYRGRRFRLSDHFDDFVLFSVDSQQKDKTPVDKGQ